MKWIGIAVLFLLISGSMAGKTWSTALETGYDLLYGLRDAAVLSNGSTVISITGPFENPVLICFSTEGEIIWFKHILEMETSRAFESNGKLVALEDGFAACYHSEPRATGINTDVAVARLNSSGEILWTYILGETDEITWMSTDIIPCSDGGLLVTGCPGTQLPGGFVLKLSSDGMQEWLTQPEEISGFALSAAETENGDFLVLVLDEYNNRTVVQQVSSEGHVSFPRTVAEAMIRFSGAISFINSYAWICSPAESNTIEAFQLNDDCTTLQKITLHLPIEYEAESADILENGFLVSGGTEDGNGLIAIYRFDGSLLWEREYNIEEIDLISDAIYLDEGILGIGNSPHISDYSCVFFIMKTDHSGYVEGVRTDEEGILLIESDASWIDLLSPGWLAACSVVRNEDDAAITSAEIMELTGLRTGYLWIPDWQSLSGSEGWLVYTELYMDSDEHSFEDAFAALLELYPDTYFIWVSQGWERNVMSVEEFFEY